MLMLEKDSTRFLVLLHSEGQKAALDSADGPKKERTVALLSDASHIVSPLRSSVFDACRNGTVEQLKELMRQHPNEILLPNDAYLDSPLYLAVSEGRFAFVKT
jgi:ankyrin repeat protein